MTSSPVDILLGLHARANGELGKALSEGTLKFGYSTTSLRPLVGMQAADVGAAFSQLEKQGHSLASIALLCSALGLAQAERDAAIHGTLLAISGPDVRCIRFLKYEETFDFLFSISL
jgi:hypothetical protein